MKNAKLHRLAIGLGVLLAVASSAQGGSGSGGSATKVAQSSDVASLDNAYKLCSVVLNTWLKGKECHVSGQDHSVDVTVDVDASKADEMCGYIVGFKSDLQLEFSAQWKVKVFAISSNENPVAECELG